MIGNIINQTINMIWNLLKYPIYICLGIVLATVLLTMIWTLYYRIVKKMKPIPNNGEYTPIREENVIVKIIKATQQLAKDRLRRDPSHFRVNGGRIICFVGRQGRGKTIAMTRMLNQMKATWKHIKIATNYEYKKQDREIRSWKDLTNIKNGKQGTILALDECQLWANCRDWKNFDVNMMQEIVFQRKQSKMLLLSTQVFSALDKNIKTQVQEIHNCYCIAGVFNIVVVKIPIINNSSGEIEKEKLKRIYCFYQDDNLRNSYDTYKMIEVMNKKGFVDRSEQLGNKEKSLLEIELKDKKKK